MDEYNTKVKKAKGIVIAIANQFKATKKFADPMALEELGCEVVCAKKDLARELALKSRLKGLKLMMPMGFDHMKSKERGWEVWTQISCAACQRWEKNCDRF